MNKFIMLIGLPGTGKSTFLSNFEIAQQVIQPVTDVFVASLDERVMGAALSDENYGQAWVRQRDSGKLKQHEIEMFEDVNNFIERAETNINKDVASSILIWDQTNLTVKTRAAKLKLFNKDKWDIYAINFNVDMAELFSRLQHRAITDNKVIPRDVIVSMMKSYECPTCAEGFKYVVNM